MFNILYVAFIAGMAALGGLMLVEMIDEIRNGSGQLHDRFHQ
jgi:hypothetical protein